MKPSVERIKLAAPTYKEAHSILERIAIGQFANLAHTLLELVE